MLQSLPKWAKIVISALISAIVVTVVLAIVLTPGICAIIVGGIYLVAAFVAVGMVVYDVLFGE